MLRTQYPKLRVLPRIMIENYLVFPDDLFNFLPARQHTPAIKAELDRIYPVQF